WLTPMTNIGVLSFDVPVSTTFLAPAATKKSLKPSSKNTFSTNWSHYRFFCRIKQFRRLATRYDNLSERFASFVALTAAFIWLC
ncbi:hypothetical protein CE195_06845, partial [Sodalis-like symbiont of Philaenus spumarius]